MPGRRIQRFGSVQIWTHREFVRGDDFRGTLLTIPITVTSMDLTPDIVQLLLVTLVILIGSACQAAIGMGLNLFAIPLLLLINPVYAPGPVLVASMVLSFLALWRVPATVDRHELKLALIGLALGSAAAGVFATAIDASSLTRLLGGFIVFGVLLALSGWSAPLTDRNLAAAGGGAGFLGTIAGVHAPPIALLYQGLAPERVRGAVLTFVGIGNAFSIIALAIVGRFGSDQLTATLYLIPGVLGGLLVAPMLAGLIDARLLRLLVLAISGVSGALLIFA